VVARQIGAESVATGHYARVNYDDGRNRWLLKRPADKSKDQTYFLFGLTQDQLSRTLFPLGDMTKPEVREIARKHGLALAEKPDSQEICFVPGGDYKRFIDAYLAEQGEALPDTAGELVTTSGEVIGEHQRHSQLHRRPAQGTRRSHRLAALRDSDQRRQQAGHRRRPKRISTRSTLRARA
jgi:tRNA-uridine 2-sulfurtransferase